MKYVIKIVVGLALLVMGIGSPIASSTEVNAQAFSAKVIYVDDAQNLVLLDTSTGTMMPLISIEVGRFNQYKFGLSPTDSYLWVSVYSYQTDNAGNMISGSQGYMLYILNPYDGSLIFSRNLFPEGFVPFSGGEVMLGTQEIELDLAIGNNPPQWSPDGTQLVWVEGVQNGDATLAVWRSDNPAAVMVLPDEPGYPYSPTWTPDGSGLVYNGVDTVGTGAGYSANGGYYTRSDGTESRRLDLKPSGEYIREIFILGWSSNQTFVWSQFDILAGAAGLYGYDLATNSLTAYLSDEISLEGAPVYSATTNTAVYRVSGYRGDVAEGLYSWVLSNDSPALISASGDAYLTLVGDRMVYLGDGQIYDTEAQTIRSKEATVEYKTIFSDPPRTVANALGTLWLTANVEGNPVVYDLINNNIQVLNTERYLAGYLTYDAYFHILTSDGTTTKLYQGELGSGELYEIAIGVNYPFVVTLPG